MRKDKSQLDNELLEQAFSKVDAEMLAKGMTEPKPEYYLDDMAFYDAQRAYYGYKQSRIVQIHNQLRIDNGIAKPRKKPSLLERIFKPKQPVTDWHSNYD